MSIRALLKDKLITHGWQVPVQLLVKYQNWTGQYSYMSQFGQDKIVLDLLKNKSNGTFVELGGSNGVTSSNSYVLEKQFGWKGICIEPNKSFYKHLAQNRGCTTVNCLVADEAKTLLFNNDGATGMVGNSGDEMSALPLSSILDMHHMPPVIDYLSLDVEGYEEKVLYNFPFDKYQFRVMTIERPSERLHDKLLSIGYQFHTKLVSNGNWIDNVYVKKELL